jgi:hypothetical protein
MRLCKLNLDPSFLYDCDMSDRTSICSDDKTVSEYDYEDDASNVDDLADSIDDDKPAATLTRTNKETNNVFWSTILHLDRLLLTPC